MHFSQMENASLPGHGATGSLAQHFPHAALVLPLYVWFADGYLECVDTFFKGCFMKSISSATGLLVIEIQVSKVDGVCAIYSQHQIIVANP